MGCFSLHRSPIYERAVLFRRFPGLSVCLFGKINKYTKMSVKRWWNDADGESKEETPSKCHFVHHKYHADGTGSYPGTLR